MKTTAQISVVIADDHPFLREGVRSFLSTEPGIAVIGMGGNGAEALQLIEEHHPAILVTDVRMPVMDGLQLLAELRRRALPTRAVVLSVGGDPTDIVELFEAGAAGYVLKDRAVSDLVEVIHAVAEGQVAIGADVVPAPDLPVDNLPHGLTTSEIAVLALLARGLHSDDISARLGISVDAVAVDEASLRRKLGAETAAELLIAALREGLIAL
ncbi:MAG: response regulator [Thermomicrobiales bacterium]